LYCNSCVSSLTQCPHCRNQVQWKTIEISPSSQRFILKPLSELLVVCNTCTTIVPRGDFAIHLSNCYTNCKCGEQVLQQNVNAHADVCSLKNVKCFAHDVKCPWEGLQKDLELHAQQCSYYKIHDVLKEWSNEIHSCQQQVEMLTAQFSTLSQQLVFMQSSQPTQHTKYQTLCRACGSTFDHNRKNHHHVQTSSDSRPLKPSKCGLVKCVQQHQDCYT